MNTTVAEARSLAEAVADRVGSSTEVTTVLCPPFVSLTAVAEVVSGSSITVGAQNMHPAASGAFTGEISAPMLAEMCSHVIIGHSERRALFSETDEFVNEKVLAAFESGLTPILCVGEQLDDREAGRADQVVEAQVRGGLAGVESPGSLVVAYEPVWAIGTGETATPEQAQAMHAFIRSELKKVSDTVAEKTRILYGGSVKAASAAELFSQPDIDGGLVGGASLDAAEFTAICRA